MHSESADAASQSQESRLAAHDVIRYECMIDNLYRTLQAQKISGIFPEKFRKVSGILFFRKSYNPKPNSYAHGTSMSKTDRQTDRQRDGWTDGRTTYNSNTALACIAR